MKTKLLFIPILIGLIVTSCNKQEENQTSKRDVYMINDFESIDQLTLMKFPFPTHNDRGRMELSTEHVTSGAKSLKYHNEFGTALEMCHYFDHIVDNGIDISDIKSINIDIFNASSFDTTCSLYIYADDSLTTILSQNYELKKGEMTNISFPLSKIVISSNAENVICSSLKINMPKTNYDKGINYTFYLDNWRVVMGSEYTAEDNLYRDKIEEIKSKISNLPQAISKNDKNALLDIAIGYDSLPYLYRGAVSNMRDYRRLVDDYYKLIKGESEIDYDLNPFLDLDEFYGISQLKADDGVKVDVLYSMDKWEGKPDDEGSIKIEFAGGNDNRLVYDSGIDLSKFDFVHFKVHNASPNINRIWFSYANNISMDIEPNQTLEANFAAPLISTQSYWSVEQIESSSSGVKVTSSGCIYFSKMYVTGRSQATLLTQLKYALTLLPDIDSLVNEFDYIKNATIVKTASQLYKKITDRSSLDEEDVNKMHALEDKYQEVGMDVCFNAYDAGMLRFSSYGQDFASSVGVEDETFGYVNTAHITVNPVHKDNPLRHEQSFTFGSDVYLSNTYSEYVFYIYNPTEHDNISLSVRTSNWDHWATSGYYIATSINRGWNEIRVNKEIMYDAVDNKPAIMIDDSGNDFDLRGDWKFTSLVGIPEGGI